MTDFVLYDFIKTFVLSSFLHVVYNVMCHDSLKLEKGFYKIIFILSCYCFILLQHANERSHFFFAPIT